MRPVATVCCLVLTLLAAPVAPAAAPQQPTTGPAAPGWPPDETRADVVPLLRQPVSPTSEIDRALAARDYEKAEQLLADAIERQSDARPLLIRIAGVFMLDRKPLNAAIALKKAEALRALDARERLELALAYVALGRDDWARPELERLAADRPDDVRPTYWLARLDYNAGQYAVAIARLREVVKRQPAFARAHDNLGLCHEALNQPDEAIGHYREAVRLTRLDEAPSAWPALNLAILLRTRGELEEAETLLREALRYDDTFAQAHYQLGVVLEASGRPDAALESLRQATAADPGYAEPYYVLARIARRQGRTADADAALAEFEQRRDAARVPEAPPR